MVYVGIHRFVTILPGGGNFLGTLEKQRMAPEDVSFTARHPSSRILAALAWSDRGRFVWCPHAADARSNCRRTDQVFNVLR